jgi:hypothetical protein
MALKANIVQAKGTTETKRTTFKAPIGWHKYNFHTEYLWDTICIDGEIYSSHMVKPKQHYHLYKRTLGEKVTYMMYPVSRVQVVKTQLSGPQWLSRWQRWWRDNKGWSVGRSLELPIIRIPYLSLVFIWSIRSGHGCIEIPVEGGMTTPLNI